MTPRQAAMQAPDMPTASPWNNEQLFSSVSVEWGTPTWLFDRLRREFDFELDAAASAQNARCEDYLTDGDDALRTEWLRPAMIAKGTRIMPPAVWLNPPWGRGIAAWVARAWQQCQKHRLTVVCLLPATTDVGWWHGIAMPHASEIRLIRGRLKFVRSDGHTGPCTKGSAIVIFRPTWNGKRVAHFSAMEKE